MSIIADRINTFHLKIRRVLSETKINKSNLKYYFVVAQKNSFSFPVACFHACFSLFLGTNAFDMLVVMYYFSFF